MKKLFIVVIFLISSFWSFSQLFVGADFAYNSTWLLNKQVFDLSSGTTVEISYGNYYGFVTGYYFSDKFGIEIDLNVNTIKQKYNGTIKHLLTDDLYNYKSSTLLKTVDIPILMKFGESSYFEIGTLIQVLNKAVYNRTFEGEDENGIGIYNDKLFLCKNIENLGVKTTFNGLGVGAVMGFGTRLHIIEDKLKLNLGFRFNYIINDLKGINGLGHTKDSEFINESNRSSFKTNPLYGGVKASLIYIF